MEGNVIRISRIIAELDESIDNLKSLRRELLESREENPMALRLRGLLADVTEDQMRRKEHQANQHGPNPMGKDGESR